MKDIAYIHKKELLSSVVNNDFDRFDEIATYISTTIENKEKNKKAN